MECNFNYNKMGKLFLIISCFVIISSCTNRRTIAKKDILPELKSFDGNYQIFEKGQYFSNPTLTYCLTFSDRLTNGHGLMDSVKGSQFKISLFTKNNSTIKVKVFQNGKIYKRKTLRGYFDSGYFHFKIRSMAPLIIVSSFQHQNNKMKLNSNNDLIVDYKIVTKLFFLFFPSAWGDEYQKENLIFSRLD